VAHNPYSPPVEPLGSEFTLWEIATVALGSPASVVDLLRRKGRLDPALPADATAVVVAELRALGRIVLLWLVGVPLLPVVTIYVVSAVVWGNGWLWALVSAAGVLPFSFLILRRPCTRLLLWQTQRRARRAAG